MATETEEGLELDASPALTELYKEAWQLYEADCLSDLTRERHPTPQEARLVASRLSKLGDIDAGRLAHRIELEANAAEESITRDPAGLVISKVRSRFNSDAEAWVRYGTERLIGLGSMTPAQMVAEGRIRDVLDYLNAIDAGVYW